MPDQYLGLQFTISAVPDVADTDVRIPVHKRREFIFHRGATSARNTNLAYTMAEAVLVDTNLFLLDHSGVVAVNNPRLLPSPTTIIGPVIPSRTNRFLLTDVILSATPTRPALPLFYQHQLGHFENRDTLLALEIVDEDMLPLTSERQIDSDTGQVFHNHQNEFDTVTGEHKLFFARYTVREEGTGSTLTHIELLSNQPVFREATAEDITPLGLLRPESRVYTLDEGPAGWDIRTDAALTYSIKPDPNALIRAYKQSYRSLEEPWFLEISNGSFLTSLPTGLGLSAIYRYDIPEFSSQAFTPFPPFRFQRSEISFRVNNHVIKTAKDLINIDPVEGMHLRVIVKNKNGLPKRAYSTDPTLVGTLFETSVEFTNGIRSIDSRGGFIDVTDPIGEGDRIECSYYYAEDRFEISQLDLNPTTNRDGLRMRYVVYLVPNTGGALDRTVHYLTVDEYGLVVSSTQTWDLALNDAIATGNLSYDRRTTSDLSTVPIAQLTFLDRFSVQSHAPLSHEATPLNPKYWVLAEAMVREASAPSEVSLIDIRVPGGGIIPALLREAMNIQPEVQWFWDVGAWDGIPYPEKATCFVEVPCDLLVPFGGRFRPNEIRDIVSRHMGLGVYPIIKAYGGDPEITAFTPETDRITIEWPSSAGKRWNVRMSMTEVGAYELLNDTPILDSSPATNSFVILGLASDTVYWFYVAEVMADGTECIGGPVGHSADYLPSPKRTGIRTLPVVV